MSDDTTPPPPEYGSTPPPPPPPGPPQGAYGVPPAPPVPPPYGAPPAGAAGYDAVAAIKYGWSAFTKSPATLLVPAIVIIVAIAVVQIVVQLVLSGLFLSTDDCTLNQLVNDDCGPSFLTRIFVAAVIAGIGGFISQILIAGLIRSSLNIVDGQPALDIGGVLAWASKPAVVTTAAFLAVLSFAGTLFFYLPGIIISFLTAFTMYFVVDKNLSGVEAIKASITFVTSKLGNTIVFMLLGALTIVAGAIACLVGVFVAIPVVLVAAAYTYRVLNDQPVAPLS
ncbi:MAG: hypothetical protein NTV23_10925 [Propionibacteriales bacterium]|nr:hypothetical protein [Propionibacteriales bacterium]